MSGGPPLRERFIRPEIREVFWKSYPVRLSTGALSRCCRRPMLLVAAMTGGFVTENCSACGTAGRVSEDEFLRLVLWVACPECRQPMVKEIVRKNYAFSCEPCGIFIKLSSLLPRWQDL